MTNPWLRDQLSRVEDLLRQEVSELSMRLLPGLDQLESAYRCTGLEFLKPSSLEALAAERAELERRRAELEMHPEFNVPVTQSERQNAAERRRLQEHQAALLPLIRICHGHPRFAHLLRSGYGTGRYSTPFWRLSYYTDRKAAAELCQLTGKKNFTALLRDYHSANDSYDTLSHRLEDLKNLPPGPRQEWEHLGKRLQGLEPLHLSTCQTRIQLALLKGGPCWKALENADLPPDTRRIVESTGLLKDQLDELRRQR